MIWEPSEKSATTIKDISEFIFYKPYSLSKKGQVLLEYIHGFRFRCPMGKFIINVLWKTTDPQFP